VHKKRSSSSAGFLLIESLIALVFLSVISFVLIQFQLRIVMMQCDALRQLKALSIAQNYIENWLLVAKKEPNIEDDIDKKTNVYDLLYSLQAIEIPSNQLHTILLQVTVSWLTPYQEKKSIILHAGACI